MDSAPSPDLRILSDESPAKSRRLLPALDDEFRLVVNYIGFTALLQVFIALDRIVEQRVTNFARRKGIDINLRKFERPRDAAVDVVALLKVDVLEEVAANRAGGTELPYISMPASCGIAPSTGISRLRTDSPMVG